jgi:integrase/recombinase XerD
MTALRQRLIREMQLQQLAPRTIEAYVTAVAGLARFYGRSPDQLQLEEVRSYLHHLIAERRLAASTSNGHAAAITFFYRHVLGQSSFDLRVRRRCSGKLPELYSQEELVRLFQAARPRLHRVLLMTAYATGLRVSELVHLQPIHIHSERLLIRVEQGKGRKDRYTLLSPQLLQELRDYWKEYQPGAWLFPNRQRTTAMCRGTAQRIFYAAKRRAGLQRGQGIHTARPGPGRPVSHSGCTQGARRRRGPGCRPARPPADAAPWWPRRSRRRARSRAASASTRPADGRSSAGRPVPDG